MFLHREVLLIIISTLLFMLAVKKDLELMIQKLPDIQESNTLLLV